MGSYFKPTHVPSVTGTNSTKIKERYGQNMNKELFFDAMEFIDDDLIREVDTLRSGKAKKTTPKWLRYATAAACLCVVVGGIYLWSQHDFTLSPEVSTDGTAGEWEDGNGGQHGGFIGGVTIPKTKISLASGEADMLAFFIYEGRIYVQYDWVYDHPELAGEYVGRATGSINEWTEADGYVDFAGSISGDFYTVNGIDPAFMLCMKYDDGSVSVYINDNGFTLVKGADLFEDRLCLSGNYTAVEYQTQDEWSYDETGTVHQLYNKHNTSAGTLIEGFIDALNKGDFVYTKDVPLDKGEKNFYDREIYHMWFTMNHGVTVHLRLFKGGYVGFDGLKPVCIKIDEAVFNKMIDCLKQERS